MTTEKTFKVITQIIKELNKYEDKNEMIIMDENDAADFMCEITKIIEKTYENKKKVANKLKNKRGIYELSNM